MPFQPNIEAARARFVERIANAYFQTWASFGFAGPEFTFERAQMLGERLAQHGFPLPSAPMVMETSAIDPAKLDELEPGQISYMHGFADTNPILEDLAWVETNGSLTYSGGGDGVVGD